MADEPWPTFAEVPIDSGPEFLSRVRSLQLLPRMPVSMDQCGLELRDLGLEVHARQITILGQDVGTAGNFIVWSHPTLGSFHPSSLVYRGCYYTLHDRGFLTCNDAKTGKEINDSGPRVTLTPSEARTYSGPPTPLP